MTGFGVPELLARTARHDADVRAWIRELPGIVAGLAREWSLQVGEPFRPGGHCAWVAPAAGRAGRELVLKVSFRFRSGEQRDEAAGLQLWDGCGTVRLHATQQGGSWSALLLERCLPGTWLARVLPEPEQDLVIARLLRRLWAQPPEGVAVRPLGEMCAAWADRFEEQYPGAADRIDPGLARDGIAMFRALPGSAERQALLCTDLHAENILAARREPWLVIDPKPYVGDPAYDVLQHMLNCEDRLAADPAGLATRMARLAGLDAGRVRSWLFARSVQESIGSPLMCQVARRLAPAAG
jgi:streptomycin 6-kinase